MRLNRLAKHFLDWVKPGFLSGHSPVTVQRGSVVHVIILDGTMSSLERGAETNAGLTYRLMSQIGAPVSVFYEAGVQWGAWRNAPDVLMGRGINRQIRRAYGYLCSRYRPGDKVYLFGYSRGAFAVRSLAGVVDQVGLLRAEHATERNIRQAYRHYQAAPGSQAAEAFRMAHCHDAATIEMIGVWDTVKALGLRLPILWKWAEEKHSFHSHNLGASVKNGFHALALDETREAFEPVLWDSAHSTGSHIEQMWFRGTHGDIGGQVGRYQQARPLANVPLTWMLGQAERCGLPLPDNWQAAFPTNSSAPSVGTWRGWGIVFLLRKRRIVGEDPSETLHCTALDDIPPEDYQTAV
ncbi:MAG: DUF2235 domain-containing protein [Thalassovita sp.]